MPGGAELDLVVDKLLLEVVQAKTDSIDPASPLLTVVARPPEAGGPAQNSTGGQEWLFGNPKNPRLLSSRPSTW